MEYAGLTWLALVAGALLTGACLVALLVVKRSLELLAGITALMAFAVSSGAFVVIANFYGRFDAVLYGFAFIVAAVGGGYALTSSLLERLVVEPEEATPVATAPDHPAGPAVIVTACVEPVSYDPRLTATLLQNLTEEGLLETSMGSLPFLFFAQKARYRAIGGQSPSQSQLEAVTERLKDTLPGWPVAWAACSGPAVLHDRVRDLAEKGHAPIVVLNLAVADSGVFTEAKRRTDALRLDSCGVPVLYSHGLADSERLAGMQATKIMQALDDPRSTGVVLVGHGQPEDRARRNPDYDLDESRFLNRVRMLLTERGLADTHVKVAWSEWRTPDVSSSVRHLAALGCRRVIVMPTCYPLDTIGTRLDLEIAVRQSRVEETIAVVTMPAWRDDPAVVEELRSRAVRLVQDGE